MNILVTGANGQLGNEMRIISKNSNDNYIFTDVNQVEGVETQYLDITDLEAIRKMVADNNVQAIVNCAAWTNVDGAEDPEKYVLVEKLNATAPENLAKAIADKQKELLQANSDLAALTGKKTKGDKNVDDSVNSLSEKQLEAQRKLEEARIAVMEEGYAKRKATLDLQHQRELDRIDKEEKEQLVEEVRNNGLFNTC